MILKSNEEGEACKAAAMRYFGVPATPSPFVGSITPYTPDVVL